ncbi:MAG: HAMP domain-containing protein, partial [Desulfobulbaceae bacterium]|nr:HAMP domain-containing protein [Desulfobulbaceae bacterium]
MTNTIRGRLTTLILLLTVLPLAVTGLAVTAWLYREQTEQAIALQREVARRGSNETRIIINEIADRLDYAGTNTLLSGHRRSQTVALSKLRTSFKDRHHSDFLESITLFDGDGGFLASDSRTSLPPAPGSPEQPTFRKLMGADLDKKIRYTPVMTCTETKEPYFYLAVPMTDHWHDTLSGAMVARVRLNQVWKPMVEMPVGSTGDIFLADPEGRIIAHSDPSLILKAERYDFTNQASVQLDHDGRKVIRVAEKVNIGSQPFFLVVDRPLREAFALTYRIIFTITLFLSLFAVIGTVLGLLVARHVVRPIESLAEVAEQIRAGNLNTKASIARNDELGLLASTFNAMTGQLIADIQRRREAEQQLKKHQAELETTVAQRTAQLQMTNNLLNIANTKLHGEIVERRTAETGLKRALEEKDVLMKEIHHRVKNNMQIISSLLHLQGQRAKSPETPGLISECIDRIRTMALLHEKLYRSDDFTRIDFADYIRTISLAILQTFASRSTKVNLQVEAEKIFLPIKAAVPCGLILNELLTNSFKYAFAEKEQGEIMIAFHNVGEKELCLEVRDNGVGLETLANDAPPT